MQNLEISVALVSVCWILFWQSTDEDATLSHRIAHKKNMYKNSPDSFTAVSPFEVLKAFGCSLKCLCYCSVYLIRSLFEVFSHFSKLSLGFSRKTLIPSTPDSGRRREWKWSGKQCKPPAPRRIYAIDGIGVWRAVAAIVRGADSINYRERVSGNCGNWRAARKRLQL